MSYFNQFMQLKRNVGFFNAISLKVLLLYLLLTHLSKLVMFSWITDDESLDLPSDNNTIHLNSARDQNIIITNFFYLLFWAIIIRSYDNQTIFWNFPWQFGFSFLILITKTQGIFALLSCFLFKQFMDVTACLETEF